MSKSRTNGYELSDAEKRDLAQLIQAGRPLPEKYRFILFEDRWTGGYIFENKWQSFRTRKNRELELTTAPHKYEKPG